MLTEINDLGEMGVGETPETLRVTVVQSDGTTAVDLSSASSCGMNWEINARFVATTAGTITTPASGIFTVAWPTAHTRPGLLEGEAWYVIGGARRVGARFQAKITRGHSATGSI